MNTPPSIADGWRTCDRQPCPEDIIDLAPHDALRISNALLASCSDAVQMAALRDLLFSHGQDWAAFRMSDWEVIEQVSNLFLTRRLHLHAAEVAAVVTISSDSSAGALGSSEAGPARVPRSPSPAAFHDYPADRATFSVPLDGAAQAAALIAAATAGQPFCPQ